jgi:hypothetical protein
MDNFARTQMGRKFFENDMTKLIKVLERIANQMELQNVREDKKFKLEEKVLRRQMKELNENAATKGGYCVPGTTNSELNESEKDNK